MSWRSGSELFEEIWPKIEASIPERDIRVEFTGQLLELFVQWDMDPSDVEDVHPDVRAAMRHAGIDISNPDRYKDDKDEDEEDEDDV